MNIYKVSPSISSLVAFLGMCGDSYQGVRCGVVWCGENSEVEIVQADHDGSSTLIAKLLEDQGNDAYIRRKNNQRLGQVDGVVCVIWDKFPASLLESHPRLKVISTISVGYEHIDLEATRRLGIQVGYTPDVLSEAVAELTVGMTIMALRRLREGMLAVMNNQWYPLVVNQMLGNQLKGKIVGIFGMGRIGQAVAKMFRAFGVARILYTNRNRLDDQKEEESGAVWTNWQDLLTQSQVLICACSANASTFHVFNEESFMKMRRDAVFVNCARGSVVDTPALVKALKEGWIQAAAVDTVEGEPVDSSCELVQLPNCVVIPHLGSSTVETREAMSKLAVDNAIRALRGESMLTPLYL